MEIICCRAEDVDLPAQSLDKVVCFDTLHDLGDPRRAVVRWVEMLKAGGQLLLRDPEITAEEVQALANGRLQPVAMVRGVRVLALCRPGLAE